MRHFLFIIVVLAIAYGCNEVAGKVPTKNAGSANEQSIASTALPESLRVGKAEALQMRGRRGKDDAVVKISARDLLSLMEKQPAVNDSFIFYFVKYDGNSEAEKDRFRQKQPHGIWSDVSKKPSSLLVGFINGASLNQGMRLSRTTDLPVIPVYDLAVLCPPPPDCACDIQQ
ncbi:hypothetical protein [Flavisolibacter ginsenosidimutans]|uniref:Uncharacterized protein n=1 Tax=Flavisolibacter ginsenosidimutans TaxID=661481 RepID=A0A5B8UJ07_9BACT|nr:hypothetical protein [Flavisolibacter ginsenosidimutans]QEC56382.1 hypothetical protein FSB75_10930 [Flavisolibacter ginsenosidimutans]